LLQVVLVPRVDDVASDHDEVVAVCELPLPAVARNSERKGRATSVHRHGMLVAQRGVHVHLREWQPGEQLSLEDPGQEEGPVIRDVEGAPERDARPEVRWVRTSTLGEPAAQNAHRRGL
jgi:hypothetical protein